MAWCETHAVVDKHFICICCEPKRFLQKTFINFSFPRNVTHNFLVPYNAGFSHPNKTHNFLFPLIWNTLFSFATQTNKQNIIYVTPEPLPSVRKIFYFFKNKQRLLLKTSVVCHLLVPAVLRSREGYGSIRDTITIWQPASFLSEFDPGSCMLFFRETHPFSNIRISHHHFLPVPALLSPNLIGR